ncbi:uncharacterized protein [Hoplias malabaricus]|uniref:uncharacterized protein n=1 Tax=Hoplias malabaricus TaxID=27720 RepID=UPI003461907B
MISAYATFCLVVIVKTFDTDELQVQSVNYGENVTVKCDQQFIKGKLQNLAWYKQSLGKLPQLVGRVSENGIVRLAQPFTDRFTVTENEGIFDLIIIKTVEEDAGIYFCVKAKESFTVFGSGTLLLFSDEKPKKHDLTEIDVKSGESITLQCSVQMIALSCSGEHSVYWLRHGSGESPPGIIYTHGDTNSQCSRSSETDSPTQSCVYKLPKTNLSLSDAGTYYCAVAVCGQILFGNGTKLNVTGDITWIVATLTVFNVISVFVIVVLAVLLHKNQQTGTLGKPCRLTELSLWLTHWHTRLAVASHTEARLGPKQHPKAPVSSAQAP